MPSPNTTSWSDATVIRSVSTASSTPSVREAPVMGEGQASRTNHASWGSSGAGRARPPRSRAMEAQQPVAPVPVEMISPDEDSVRSGRPGW